MRRAILVFIFLFSVNLNYSQVSVTLAQFNDSLKPKVHYAFMPGDIIIGVNIGRPQVGSALVQVGINAYEKFAKDNTFSFSMSHNGVYNARAEYGLLDNLSMGLSVSYWDIDVDVIHDYIASGLTQQDVLNINISSLALGVRANLHLTDEVESKYIDPYFGIGLGSTLKKKVFKYTTTNPDIQEVQEIVSALPSQVTDKLKLSKQGWVPYLATTFGIRIFPVKFIGLNLEAGWDHGTFLYGGIVFKFGTPPIKSLQD